MVRGLLGGSGTAAILAAVTVLVAVAPLASANAIADGGFESGTMAGPFGSPLPLSFGHWSFENNEVQLVNPPAPVHTGQWSLQVDTRTATTGSAVYQDFDSGTLSYNWTFWIYPSDGQTVAEVVYNWDRGTGFAVPGSVLRFEPTMTVFTAWQTPATLPALAPGGWREVRVLANRCTATQQVYFDGVLVGTVSAGITPPSGNATVILGDVAFHALQGRYWFDDVAFDLFQCNAPTVCPRSMGFWKTHAAAWPVDSLTLGSVAYTKAQLLAILRTPPRGDASLILADQLIAAKLNVANGSDPAPVAATIADADALLGAHGGPLPYHVKASSPEGQKMVADAAVLDDYNNGRLTSGCGSSSEGVPLPPKGGGSPPAVPLAGVLAARGRTPAR